MMKTLVLIPTEFERSLTDLDQRLQAFPDVEIAVCGFGPVAAAVQSTRLIADHRPERVILAGIAGAYTSELAIGRAYGFRAVGLDGVGAGEAEGFRSAAELGWRQSANSIGGITQQSAGGSEERLPLQCDADLPRAELLLTVCSSAADALQVTRRCQRYPGAVAEEMEGFSVALACRLADVPLTVIRGISNVAGNRNQRDWRCREAMASAVDLVERLICPRRPAV
ncbi:MAG: futalosine hydrolase [Planctomycetaceae bacterium]